MTHAYPTHARYTEPPEAAWHGAGLVRADYTRRRAGPRLRGTTRPFAGTRRSASGQPAHDAPPAACATEIPRRRARGPRLSFSEWPRSIAAREPRIVRLDPFKPKCPDPGCYRLRQNLPGVRARASSVSPGLERAVRARTAPVRGV